MPRLTKASVWVFQRSVNWKPFTKVKPEVMIGTTISSPGKPFVTGVIKVTPFVPPTETGAFFAALFGVPATLAGGVHELFTSPSLIATKSWPGVSLQTLGYVRFVGALQGAFGFGNA